jgi:ribosomal-protein-alanine N-acetyltransferase
MKIPVLKSERLILRRFRQSDAEDVLELFKFVERKKINNIKQAKDWIKKSVGKNEFYLAIFLKENKKVIGHIELCHLNWFDFKAGEIGYAVNKKYWGKGYATEACSALISYCFNKLKFVKVYADTDPDKKASQRVLEKLGFKLEGIIRKRRIVSGRWTDEWDYGLLRDECKR